MDFNCKYIDKRGLCNSPSVKLKEYLVGCFSLDYKQCCYFPESELNNVVKLEKESDLEKESKEE